MLLDPSALRRRLPLIIVFVLASMILGAAWAASRTPVYRSTAVVTGPADLASIVRSGDVADGFRTRIGTIYGDDVAARTVAFASESGQRVELATEAQSAGVAEEQTSLYAEAVLATRPDVVLESPATFPLSTRSPNLRRIALATFLVGATLGWAVAVILERRSATSAAADPPEQAPATAPIIAAAPHATPALPKPEPANHPTPQAPTPASGAPGTQAPRITTNRAAGKRGAIKRGAIKRGVTENAAAEKPRVVRLPDPD